MRTSELSGNTSLADMGLAQAQSIEKESHVPVIDDYEITDRLSRHGIWINLSLRFAAQSATEVHLWHSVGALLHLGQPHKSLYDKHKPFVHSSSQTAHSDQISVAPFTI
jgi:hypothetical protein